MNGPEHFVDIEPEDPVYELPSWDLPGRAPKPGMHPARKPAGRKRPPRKAEAPDSPREEISQ